MGIDTSALVLALVCAAVCILLLVWALRSYFKYGKNYQPDFTDEYTCEAPDASIHPALIGRLWRWNRPNWKDLTVTLMRLADRRAVRIEVGYYSQNQLEEGANTASYQGEDAETNTSSANANSNETTDAIARKKADAASSKTTGGKQEMADYRLIRVSQFKPELNNIDRATLAFLFDRIGGQGDSLWLGNISAYSKQHPRDFFTAIEAWQEVVSDEIDNTEFFEFEGKRRQRTMLVVGAILLILGIVLGPCFSSFFPPLFAIPTAIVLWIIAHFMPRYAVVGNNLLARCKALRNCLRDGKVLEVAQKPLSEQEWNTLMPYAYLFDVGNEALQQAQAQLETQGQAGTQGQTQLCVRAQTTPWHVWLEGDSGLPPAGTVLEASFRSAEVVASNTIANEKVYEKENERAYEKERKKQLKKEGKEQK